MIRFIVAVISCIYLSGCCQENSQSKMPVKNEELEEAFLKAGEKSSGLKKFMNGLPDEWKPGVAFLIAYMPEEDLKGINLSMLYENMEYAYKARNTFSWAASIPDELFYNDVLPYAVVDETRENWRKLFYDFFSVRVADCKDICSAIKRINKNINEIVKVEYDTRREKTNQSPSESMRQNMASCTGLSILLVDAFRSVGIPARFAGVASWYDDRGNHSWVEVWLNGEWHITEFYMPEELNNPWFLANSGMARHDERKYAVYATSYKPTGEYFPMVWNENSKQIHAINVSGRYIGAYIKNANRAKQAGTHVPVKLRMFKNKEKTTHSGDRIAVNVDVFDDVLQIDGGRTSGAAQDMNDVLTFFLEKNKNYTFRYQNSKGDHEKLNVRVNDQPVVVDAYME